MKRPHILLVDDDRDIVRGVSIRLRAAGFDITSAYDGMTGVAAAESTQPDAIVLDIRMPGMDGLSALARLRERDSTRHIPVLILTANVAETVRNKALNLGARFFLEKPCVSTDLVNAIRAAIGQEDQHSDIRPTLAETANSDR